MMNLEESKQFLRDLEIDPEEVAEDGRRYGKALNEYADAVSQNEPIAVVCARHGTTTSKVVILSCGWKFHTVKLTKAVSKLQGW